MTSTGFLRQCGVFTPTYNRVWEINWSKRLRRAKKVWARSPKSRNPSARKWHWVDQKTLNGNGIKWKPINGEWTGRSINPQGYVTLTRLALSHDDILLCEKHRLFLGRRKLRVLEHRLVALKKYGKLPRKSVVRHVNGIKADNRPENLLLGTSAENTMDHNSARLMAMYWRERAIAAESGKHIITDMPDDRTATTTNST